MTSCLDELVRLAATPRTETGCRVADADFHADMIGSFFAFFGGRSRSGAKTWALRTWREFVEDGVMYSMSVAELPSPPRREQAWRAGLERGAVFLATQARLRRTRPDIADVLIGITEAVGCAPLTPP